MTQSWQSTASRAPQRVAVLPFSNMSASASHAYFADGMTEAIITALAHVPELRVISRQSVIRYKDTSTSLPEIAQQLQADVIIEGSVTVAETNLRVTVQMIHGESDEHLWARTFRAQLQDVLLVQEDIAQVVAQEVGVNMRVGGRARSIRPEAYDAYLRGLYDFSQGDEALREAIRLDPGFLPAHTALARNQYFSAFFGMAAPAQAYADIESRVRHVLERDEADSEAHGLLALVRLHHDWDYGAAERHFRRALELSPSNAQVHHDHAHMLLALGRVEEAVEASRIAAELDPGHPGLIACLGWHGLHDGQDDLAMVHARRAVQMAPEFFWAHLTLGWVYAHHERPLEAVGALRRAVTLTQGLPIAQAALGHVLAMQGQGKEARTIARELEELSTRQYVSAYEIASVYAGLGDADETCRMLRRAREERSNNLVFLGWEPRFDPVRNDPRIGALLDQLGLPRQRRAVPVPHGHGHGSRGPSPVQLTPREREVLACVARGFSDKKIGQHLSISAGTVSKHVANMLGKLELHNRVELARWATDAQLDA